MTKAYDLIKEHYGKRVAYRSGLPLIKHIDDGLKVLTKLGENHLTKEAFVIHPLVQADCDLAQNYRDIAELNTTVVMLAMEYRNIANQSLSDIVEKVQGGLGSIESYCVLKRPIKISPINEVNKMLIADKVQNYFDFLRYHNVYHPRKDELDYYFNKWLQALGVNKDEFTRLTNELD